MSASAIFRKTFTKKYLTSIFVDHIRTSGAVGIDRVSPINFERNLPKEVSAINKKVRSGEYRYTRYKQKLISKGADKKPRVISIPTVRDRLVLRCVCDFLSATFHSISLEIPQLKISRLKSALASGDYSEYIKIDLENFYPSIDHERLGNVLRKKVRKVEAFQLVERAIATETVAEGPRDNSRGKSTKGVPQGLSISNILAEIYIAEFDAYMEKQKDVFYLRYVDDILILCKEGSSDLIAEKAIKYLKGMKLEPHEISETGKSSKGKLGGEFDFLGYRVVGSKLSIRLPSIQRFESSLAKILTTYRYRLKHAKNDAEKERAKVICQWRLNLRITGCIFNGKRLSWVFYFSQINDTTPLRKVDSTISIFRKRFDLKDARFKSTLKAFYESARTDKTSHKYIVNFDSMNVQEKKEVLEKYLGHSLLAGVSNEDVERYFSMRIRAVVKELEEDLFGVS